MKTSLKVNLLKHLIAKKEEGGFTLIELLVVIIIIGILAAIALPSFLNQANKAKQSEAKTYVGSVNRAQQAYYLEEGNFTTTLADLGLGIKSMTENYRYEVEPDNTVNANFDSGFVSAYPGTLSTDGKTFTVDETSTLKPYMGGYSTGRVDPNNTQSESTVLAVVCEAQSSPASNGPKEAATVFATGNYDAATGPSCPTGFKGL